MAKMMCMSSVGWTKEQWSHVVTQSLRLPPQGSIALVCWHRRSLWRPAGSLFSNAHKCECHVFWVGFGNYSGNTIFAVVFAVTNTSVCHQAGFSSHFVPCLFSVMSLRLFFFLGVCRLCKQLYDEGETPSLFYFKFGTATTPSLEVAGVVVVAVVVVVIAAPPDQRWES